MNKQFLQELFRTAAKPRTAKEAEALLADLLTPAERTDVAVRIQIVKMLLRSVPHRTISEKLGVSIAKVTRGSRALKRSRGGFKKFLD